MIILNALRPPYQVIYADPPWSYRDKSTQRGGAERHYSTMTLADIRALPVDRLAGDDCALFMWATWPLLDKAFEVIAAWGFSYKTIGFVWVKTYASGKLFWGMGHHTRANTEPCLLATKGRPKRINAGVHSVIMSPIERHSKKPDEVREQIVRLYGNVPRAELFARDCLDGWDVWGNEAEKAK